MYEPLFVIGDVGDRVEIGLSVLWIMLIGKYAHTCTHLEKPTIMYKKNKLQSEM